MSQKLSERVAVLELQGKNGVIHPVVVWDDRHTVLIDTGLPMQFELIQAELETLGLRPDQVTHMLFTHQDIDHIGCALEFIALNAEIETVAHVDEAPYLDGTEVPHKLAALEANLDHLSPEMKGFYDMLKAGFANRKIAITELVQHGDVLPICGGIQVVSTKGHTAGHTCYFIQDAKVLVGGDAFNGLEGELKGPNPMYSFNMEQARDSLVALLDYPIETLVAYHGGVITGNIHNRLKAVIQEK